MPPLYIARWPDGTISFFTASAEDEIFFILDRESIPDEVELYRVDCPDIKDLHIGTAIFNNGSHPVITPYVVGEGSLQIQTKLTKINLPFK
jgi:hypothetical protein